MSLREPAQFCCGNVWFSVTLQTVRADGSGAYFRHLFNGGA